MSSAVDARPKVIRPGVLAVAGAGRRVVAGAAVPGARLRAPEVPGAARRAVDRLPGTGAAHPPRRSPGAAAARAAAARARTLGGGGGVAAPARGRRRPHRDRRRARAGRAVARAPRRADAGGSRAAAAAAAVAGGAAAGRPDPASTPISSRTWPRPRWRWRRPADAADIYERLSALDIANRHDWLLRAARWRLATGALTASVDLYLAASRAAPAEWAAREDALRALEVLTSANRGKESLQAADAALGRWPTDRRLLDRGITLARAQGDGARAKRWSERLVALGPDDDAISAAAPGHRARRRRRRGGVHGGDAAGGAPPRGCGAAAQARRDRHLVGPRRGGAGRLGLAGAATAPTRARSARSRSATICSTTIASPRCWSGAPPTARSRSTSCST